MPTKLGTASSSSRSCVALLNDPNSATRGGFDIEMQHDEELAGAVRASVMLSHS